MGALVPLGGLGIRRLRVEADESHTSPSFCPLDADASTTTLVDKVDDRTATSDQNAKASARLQAAMTRQQQRFNEMAIKRSELQREQEVLDSLLMAQLKHDGELLKEWIRLI